MSDNKKMTFKMTMGIIGTIVFFLSYLPFLLLVDYGINGTHSGLIGGYNIYGFDAMADCFLWLCIIPIYPVCILYQIIFGIAYIRKHKRLRIITIAVVVSIVTAILIAGVSFEIKKAMRLSVACDEITEYLADKYGEGVTEGITIRIEDYDDDTYTVTSPVLPEFGDFVVTRTDDYNDTLTQQFVFYNQEYQEAFETYLTEQYDLPDGYRMNVFIEKIYFGDYRDGDDYETLIADTTYEVNDLEVNVDSIEDEELIDLINYIYENEYPKFADQLSLNYYMIYIRVDGETAFSVQNLVEQGFATIRTYTNYHGQTELNNVDVEFNG